MPRRITGALWLLFGIGFLVADFLQLQQGTFSLGFMYYIVLWGYLFFCVVAGVMLFGPVPLGRWLVTALASLLAAYAVLIWLKAEGAPLWGQLWCSAMLLFSVWSIYLVQKRAA
jgi:hypothetical protein